MPLPEPPPVGQAMLPRDTYENKVVLVTGGGTGLGKAIAVEFGRVGAAVAIVSRSEEHRLAGCEAVREVGARAVEASADIRKPDEVRDAFDRIESELGHVDVLINNAAGNFPVLAEDLSINGWRAVIDIVLNGAFICSQEFARRSREAEKPGAILNILSIQANYGGPGMVHSASAKAGVQAMTKTLAVEWAKDGIRVNGLTPSQFYHTDYRADFQAIGQGGTMATEANRRTPGGRGGRLQEFGWAATYLCSPYAGYVSGNTMVMDGAGSNRTSYLYPEFEPIGDQIKAGMRAK